jgi:HemY protein
MKPAVIAVLVFIALAGFIGVMSTRDPGYILVAWDRWAVETSLWTGVIMLLLLLLLFWVLRQLVKVFRATGRIINPMSSVQIRNRARSRTLKGYIAYANGEWETSRDLLVKAAPNSAVPLLNWLLAAHASHYLGETDTCEYLLKCAESSSKDADVPVGLARARMYYEREEYEKAEAVLRKMEPQAHSHPHVLYLMKNVLEKRKDWIGLRNLLPELRKRRLLTGDEYLKTETRVHRRLLDQAISKAETLPDREKAVKYLEDVRDHCPKPVRRGVDYTYRFAEALLGLGAHHRVESLLRFQLERAYEQRLAYLYGLTEGDDSSAQLLFAESLLMKQPEDEVLLLSLGRICLRNRLWGKAREYFQASISMRPLFESYNELGRLLYHLGDPEKAAWCFRSGLEQASDPLPDLPMPEGRMTEEQIAKTLPTL